MSWLWENETTAQAQYVVSALQNELDERESKIKALEVALKREQHEMLSLLEDEVKELEQRRHVITKELANVNELIQAKKKLIECSKSDKKLKKKKKKNEVPEIIVDTSGDVIYEKRHEIELISKKKKKEKKRENEETVIDERSGDDGNENDFKVMLPMDKHLEIVAKEEPNVAFIIQRSNNKNTVVYAGCKSRDGNSLDPMNPMKVFWIMYEKDGNPREDLTMIERNTAYGITFKPSDVPGEYIVAIASLRDRDCVLRLDKHGNVMALSTINGKKGMLLRRVFVQATTSWGIPTVAYVDIFGVHPITFEPVYERKKNK
ncbi:unnamed protein product [Peronospora belbahrii]|uniref:DUF4833 domain-containing protein n=1 Tax=Peronospora belbahrii TaxID=622444 RepID=A0ABN8D3V9_9STRA|nr:unnamed protein product [Peronospora belbahrii]